MSAVSESPGLATLAVLVAVVFIVTGSAKVLAVPAMRELAAHVGFDVAAYRRIGVLELLGAGGVLAGLTAPTLGALAGAGLFLLMLGALTVHLRNGDRLVEVMPAVGTGLLTLAYLLLAVAQLQLHAT